MLRNMGAFDRRLRGFVIAPLAIVLGLIAGTGTVWGIVPLVVAGIMLATAVTGFCPTYTLLGISTNPRLHRVGHHLRSGHA